MGSAEIFALNAKIVDVVCNILIISSLMVSSAFATERCLKESNEFESCCPMGPIERVRFYTIQTISGFVEQRKYVRRIAAKERKSSGSSPGTLLIKYINESSSIAHVENDNFLSAIFEGLEMREVCLETLDDLHLALSTIAYSQGVCENVETKQISSLSDAFAEGDNPAVFSKQSLTNFPIANIDMLYLDAMGSNVHLLDHLIAFSPNIQKYICISTIREQNHIIEGVLEKFLACNKDWDLERRFLGEPGLMVLKNKSYMNKVDYAIKNKIILCTGPSLNRKALLKNNTEQDMLLIPFKSIFLSTNDQENLSLSFYGKQPICQLLSPPRGHQLDCTNCILTSIQNAINCPGTNDEDIILFKHESCYIHDMYLVRRCVEKILDGHDMVIRYGDKQGYCQTNGFFIKVSAARKVFENLSPLKAFNENYRFCEEYFGKMILAKMRNPYVIHHHHMTRGIGELGLCHIPPPWGGEDTPWDQEDYFFLFADP